MFRKIGDSLRRFMYGRYGSDELNLALLILAVTLSLINTLLSILLRNFSAYIYVIYPLLHALVFVLLGLNLARTFSRSIAKRQQENKRFLRLKTRLTDRHNRYFRCPKCSQTVRVPRHRGKISIRCPKCGERFVKKT